MNRFASAEWGVVHDDHTDNYAKAQALVDYVHVMGGGLIEWSPGIARVSRSVVLKDNVWIVGADRTSGIRNTYTGNETLQSPFWLGYWALAFNGTRPLGSSDPYERQIDRHLVSDVTTEGALSVSLTTPAEAGNFSPGSIAYLRSQEARSETSTGVDLEVPLQNTLVRIKSSNSETGLVEFDNPAGFTSATAPYLCKIKRGAGNWFGEAYFAQNVRIERLQVYGYAAFGSNNTGAYNCHMRDITGDVTNVVSANGFAYCSFDGFRGSFVDRVVETKFCAHDSHVKNINVVSATPVTSGIGMFSLGEFARNITVADFSVSAPQWDGPGHIFQLQPGKNTKYRNGTIFAPAMTGAAVNFYADPDGQMENVTIDNVEIHHASQISVLFGSGTHEARNCRLNNCTFYSKYAGSSPLAIAMIGGQGNVIHGSWFDKGEIYFTGATAAGNRVIDCVLGTASVQGAYASANEVIDCRSISSSGVVTPVSNPHTL